MVDLLMKKPEVIITDLVKMFSLSSNEIKVYQLLLKKSMTIKQLKKALNVSERTLRTYIDVLLSKRFIKRKIIDANRLKYVYYSNPSDNIVMIIRKKLNSIDMKREKIAKDIIKGVE